MTENQKLLLLAIVGVVTNTMLAAIMFQAGAYWIGAIAIVGAAIGCKAIAWLRWHV